MYRLKSASAGRITLFDCHNVMFFMDVSPSETGEHIDLEDLVDDFVTFYFAGKLTCIAAPSA